MNRALASLLLGAALAGVAACGGGPQPERTPSAPIDLVFVPAAGGGLNVYSTADGGRVAQLPAGAFAAGVTGGGDLGEAYLVNRDGLSRVKAGRPFVVTRLGDPTGAGPWQAALVPAPGLTTFVGERTVLVTLSTDGQLAGYQAGTRIWRHAIAGAAELRQLDQVAALRVGDAWSTVIAVDGRTVDLVAACPAGPWAMVGDRVLVPCPGAASPGLSIAPLQPARPWALAAGPGGAVLAWPDGTFARYSTRGENEHGRGAGGGRPGISPNGRDLYWPREVAGAEAVATSRDGNFLLAIGGGRLQTLTTSPRRRLATWPAEGSDIQLVVGG